MREDKKIKRWRCPICGEVFTSRTTEEMYKHWACVSNHDLDWVFLNGEFSDSNEKDEE